MGVERGVATSRAQVVWPMMTVTVTSFEAAILKNLRNCQNEPFFSLFSCANIIQRKFHTIFVSQTFLSERTPVFWLNKILLKTCFHGYWACSVSRSAIKSLSAIRD